MWWVTGAYGKHKPWKKQIRVKQTFFAFTLKYNRYTSVQPCTIELGCRKLSLQKRTNFLMIVNWNLKQFFKINTQTTAYKGTLFI